MVQKDAWYDFTLKFIEACFVSQHIVYSWECSICTWEQCVFCCFGKECFVFCSNVSLKANGTLLIFCLDDLSTDSIEVSGVFKSPIIIVLLSIFSFMSQYLFYIFRHSCVWYINIYECYIFFLDWYLYHYVMAFSVFCYSLCFKVCPAWYECCYSSFLFVSIYIDYLFPSFPVCVCL